MKQFGHKKKITNQKQKDKENSNRCNRLWKKRKKRIIILFGDILGILFLISETLNQTLNKPPIKNNFFYKPSTIKRKLNFRMQNNWLNQRKNKNKANKQEHKNKEQEHKNKNKNTRTHK